MKLDDQVHLLGIRHHGPGCAMALIRALEELQPDVILLEGAQELEADWRDMLHAEMRPPVAQLLYDPKNPRRCSLYPWAEFSPEWQAMTYAGRADIPLHMIDLPASVRFALDEAAEAPEQESAVPPEVQGSPGEACETAGDSASDDPLALCSPLHALLAETGIADGEVWWDHYVEHHQGGLKSFAAIATLVQEARAARDPLCTLDALREAWMRRALRSARKDYQRIAVVCGAWHVPALAAAVKVKDDNALLKGLKKRKVDQAWMPYTYQRLSVASGYGAGVEAPNWYEHLFGHLHQQQPPEKLAISWLTQVAGCLRAEGFLVSSAQIIDGVRLALSLAQLRDRQIPGLAELQEAAQATMTEGAPEGLEVIAQALLVGEKVGTLPPGTPLLPLEQDLNAQLKRLRLKRTKESHILQLDLRQPLALQRSQLFNRLNLLNIPWAQGGRRRGLGTSRESWTLSWQPEFAIGLLDASLYGNTLDKAAAVKMAECLAQANTTALLVTALDQLFRCHLPEMIPPAIQRLGDVVAVSADLPELMQALLELAQLIRYGSVRSLSGEGLQPLVDVICIRVSHGLVPACTAIDERSAYAMLEAMDAAHSAISMLAKDSLQQRWQQTLQALWDSDQIHPVIHGRVGRLLRESGLLEQHALEQRFCLNLSAHQEPTVAAAWIEGLLAGGAASMLYDTALFGLLDQWICQLEDETLLRVLPVIRRAFSAYGPQDLQLIGQRVAHGGSQAQDWTYSHDQQLAQQALDSLTHLLGLNKENVTP